LAYVTQTTLSVDDTAAMVDLLRAFPDISGPHKEGICYATTVVRMCRQNALRPWSTP
jgi:4-hydroxy-3-methylbut-2-enyl diphosphate reductase